MRLRAILAVVVAALLGDRNRRGKKLGLAGSTVRGLPPDAGEIGLAVESARRGTGGRLVPFHVGVSVHAIFAQRVELRGVAEADVERRGLRRLHHDAFLLERCESRARRPMTS